MFLDEYVSAYELERSISTGYAAQLRYAVQSIQAFAGMRLQIGEVTDELLNRYILHLERTRSKSYARGRRGHFMAILRAAKIDGLVQRAPQRIRIVRVGWLVPEGWSKHQVRALLRVAVNLPGHFVSTGIRRAWWFTAFICVAWETSLRRGDVIALRHSKIDRVENKDGVWGHCVVVQGKTRRPHKVWIRPLTMKLIERIKLPGDDRVFVPFGRAECFYQQFRRITQAAGLRGSSKYLRSGSATNVESKQAGTAKRQLGHATDGLAARHYIVPRLMQESDRVLPDRLF